MKYLKGSPDLWVHDQPVAGLTKDEVRRVVRRTCFVASWVRSFAIDSKYICYTHGLLRRFCCQVLFP